MAHSATPIPMLLVPPSLVALLILLGELAGKLGVELLLGGQVLQLFLHLYGCSVILVEQVSDDPRGHSSAHLTVVVDSHGDHVLPLG